MEYQATVNNKDIFHFSSEDIKNLDLIQQGPHAYHLIRDQASYTIEVLELVPEEKQIKLRINNQEYTVEVKDTYDLLVKKLGLSSNNSAKQKQIKAPMPGLVLQIMAEEGQSVAKGDSLLILEAMKMENVIKAAGDGVVKTIHVEKGNTVEKNQMMIELD